MQESPAHWLNRQSKQTQKGYRELRPSPSENSLVHRGSGQATKECEVGIGGMGMNPVSDIQMHIKMARGVCRECLHR